LAKSSHITQQTKHIDIRVHHIRELIDHRVIELRLEPNETQMADVLTYSCTYDDLMSFIGHMKLDPIL